jgi:hypothetical protein
MFTLISHRRKLRPRKLDKAQSPPETSWYSFWEQGQPCAADGVYNKDLPSSLARVHGSWDGERSYEELLSQISKSKWMLTVLMSM